MDHSANHADYQQNASSEAQKLLDSFWRQQADNIHNLNTNVFRNPELPLARIKKIMKLDDDVKMISGEAPVLFAKAVEVFIAELSLRAWVNTEENKRRTLQRNDISSGISKYDQFDFLIDIVPREEAKPVTQSKRADQHSGPILSQDQLQNYFFQLSQQQQLQTASGQTGGPIQIIQAAPGQNQQQQFTLAPQVFQLPVQGGATATSSQGQDSTQQLAGGESGSTNGEKQLASGPILLSNIYGNSGEVQQLTGPIMSSQQYQTLLQNPNSGQSGPILISNPQSLSQMPTQFITNAGQVMQTIIPTTGGNIDASRGKVQTAGDGSES